MSQKHLGCHKDSQEALRDIMYHLEYPKETHGKVVIEMSFTYLHWKVAEALGNEDSKFNV